MATRAVAATAAPALPTAVPSWLERTRLFGGVPLSVDVNNPEGAWVLATTAQARGRSANDITAPLHYNPATGSPEWPLWKMAIDAELAQLDSRKASTLRPRHLVGDNLLTSTTWVFTVKDTVDPVSGAPLLTFKARLTARGDLVDPARINPDQLNAPTIDPDMVRGILALVAADPTCQFI